MPMAILTEDSIAAFREEIDTSPSECITYSFLQDLAETYKNINSSLIESDTFLLQLTDLTVEIRQKLFPPGHDLPEEIEVLFNGIQRDAIAINLQKKTGQIDKNFIDDVISIGMRLSKILPYVNAFVPLLFVLQKPMLN